MKEIIIVICTLACACAFAKSGRTYYNKEMMSTVREKIRRHDWAKSKVDSIAQSAEWYLQKSPRKLWDFIPPPEQLRAINVCTGVGCPYCGDEIIKKGGHYPWILDRDRPYTVECPVCGRVFPEVPFEPWNTAGRNAKPESGHPIADSGVGWVDEEGNRYYFVPYFIYWQRWRRDIIDGMRTLGQAYLLTGDKECARRAAVMMCRVAQHYPEFAYSQQAYHEGQFGIRGRISDRIWSTDDDSKIALSYDTIYPIFDDPKLQEFLVDRGVDNSRRLIEQNMLQVMAEDVMTGHVHGNMGAHQLTMCHLAIVLDNEDPKKGHTTAQMREWLMSGDGRVEDLLWNGFWRDGLGSESSPSYASGWCRKFYQIAELLPRLGVEIWDNPRLKKMADIGLDMTVAGEFTPSIGDCGSVQGTKRIAWGPELQGAALEHYGDPRYAKALEIMGAEARDLWDEPFDPERVERIVAEHGTDLNLKTRDLGGYGLAVLESGEGPNRRGLSMYYGDATGGHGHYDRLTIGLFAMGYPRLPEMGYPVPFTSPKRFGFTSNTVSHYSVLLNRQRHRTRHSGHLNTLASASEVQLVDASAEVAYKGLADLYRRTCALIDISDSRSYVLDIFRVKGGREHHWSFHGPAFFSNFSVAGGEFGPVQEEGTLAGPDIEWAQQPPPYAYKESVALPIQDAEGIIDDERDYRDRSEEGFAAYRDDQVLVKSDGATMTYRCQTIEPGSKRVFFEIYDYAEKSNQFSVQIGDVSATVDFQPADERGFRWVHTDIELSEPANTVTITADDVGQTYIQLRNIVISADTSMEVPRITSANTSGFEFLYDVQRMKPQGEWSATWAHPDENAALTVHMPGGCVEELITALTEPPLQPGNPDTMRYLLGRNLQPDDRALARSYICTIEPHKKDPAIHRLTRLRCDAADERTVGLAVERTGAVDYIHSSIRHEKTYTWTGPPEPLEAAAEFAMVTVDESGVRRACVINGTHLQYEDFSISPNASPTGRILSADPNTNTVALDDALDVPSACEGSAIIVSNDLHSESYMIQRATVEGDTTTLDFGDTLFIVGMGAVEKIDAESGAIISHRDLQGYGRIEGGRHEGRWLYNEDRSRAYLIENVADRRIRLRDVDEPLDEVFMDADGDGRRLYWICDFGPGDRYRIPGVSFYRRD